MKTNYNQIFYLIVLEKIPYLSVLRIQTFQVDCEKKSQCRFKPLKFCPKFAVPTHPTDLLHYFFKKFKRFIYDQFQMWELEKLEGLPLLNEHKV